jgi:hypothetical protein
MDHQPKPLDKFYQEWPIKPNDRKALLAMGIVDYRSLRTRKWAIQNGKLPNVSPGACLTLKGLMAYLDSFKSPGQPVDGDDLLRQYSRDDFVEFFTNEDSTGPSSSDATKVSIDRNSSTDTLGDSSNGDDRSYLVSAEEAQNGSAEENPFFLPPQGFHPSQVISSDLDDEAQEPARPEIEVEFVEFGGRQFRKGGCYNYRHRKWGQVLVGIKAFYQSKLFRSGIEVHGVRIIPISETFFGEDDEFYDAVKHLCPGNYIRVKSSELDSLCLSHFEPDEREPKVIPPLIYEPRQMGNFSFGFTYENTGANSIGLRDEICGVELFCGAGGMHQGYKSAGFKTISAVDKDPQAVETFNLNNEKVALCMDANEFIDKWKPEDGPAHLVHGSSPCQGFSTANRNGGQNDEKNNELVFAWTDGLRKTGALVGVFENVMGMWSIKGFPYLRRQLLELFRHGYQWRVMSLKGRLLVGTEKGHAP